MFAGKAVTLLDALLMSASSMLVVFAVLLLLYVIIKLFPVVFRINGKNTGTSTTEQDDDALRIVLISAAIRQHRRRKAYPNPMARSAFRSRRHVLEAGGNAMARDCVNP